MDYSNTSTPPTSNPSQKKSITDLGLGRGRDDFLKLLSEIKRRLNHNEKSKAA